MTALERILGRELDARTLEALDFMDNGKPENLALLLELGEGVGQTYIDAAYPDPKFDLAQWQTA